MQIEPLVRLTNQFILQEGLDDIFTNGRGKTTAAITAVQMHPLRTWQCVAAICDRSAARCGPQLHSPLSLEMPALDLEG